LISRFSALASIDTALKDYPNVDGVIAIVHRQGCGMQFDGPDHQQLDRTPAGFALFFHNFSTWMGRRGLYLEDLFVKPAVRGRGYGRALLVRLAQIARERECGRMEWAVLDWNEPAIQFYRKLGARPNDDWTIFRLTMDGISQLAGE